MTKPMLPSQPAHPDDPAEPTDSTRRSILRLPLLAVAATTLGTLSNTSMAQTSKPTPSKTTRQGPDDSVGSGSTGSKGAAPKWPTPFGQPAAGYHLTFAEEFDQGFDNRLWNDHIWYERSHPILNYAVENGALKIWPARDESGEFVKRTIDTDGKFEQAYGYFEMEAKLPRGRGLWPAFWLLARPGKRRPEIDIMEAYPGGVDPWSVDDKAVVPRPRAYGVTTWIDEKLKAGFLQYDTGKDLSERFHKYAVKWEPHQQTFYFDGKEIHKVKVSMADPKFILLDLWYGSAAGEPDATTPLGKRNSFEVNYVRAWRFRD